MCVAVVWGPQAASLRMRLLRGVLRLALCDWQLATWTGASWWKRAHKFRQLSPTSSLCRDVAFRRVFQCEVNWSFTELLLSCVGDHSMLCNVARIDGFLICLSFLCMSGDRVVCRMSHFASLSWVFEGVSGGFRRKWRHQLRKCRAPR